MMPIYTVWVRVERGPAYGTVRWIDSQWIVAEAADRRLKELTNVFAAFKLEAVNAYIYVLHLADGTLEK